MKSRKLLQVSPAAWRLACVGVLASLLLALGGCASGPRANPHDPFEPFNRGVSNFNEGVDAIVLKPTATLYKNHVPPLVRTGVSNFFGNLTDAWSGVNSALQFKFQNAAENFMRFGVNTVLGLGGIMDLASDFNIERHREDFGQTLGRWGVPAGPYIVLPLLGPSTLRDTLALPIDRKANFVHDVDPWSARWGLYFLQAVDVRSNLLRAGSVLDEIALDKYSFIRDAHLQRRRAEVYDGVSADTGGQLSTEDAPQGDPTTAPVNAPAGAPDGAPATRPEGAPGAPVPAPAR